jgi:hypothetical protein
MGESSCTSISATFAPTNSLMNHKKLLKYTLFPLHVISWSTTVAKAIHPETGNPVVFDDCSDLALDFRLSNPKDFKSSGRSSINWLHLILKLSMIYRRFLSYEPIL